MGVVFKFCRDYQVEKVEEAIRGSLDLLDIDLRSEVSGKRVLLKPNLLSAFTPDECVTTHPILIEGLVRILKDLDCEIWLGDSPNGVQKSLDDVWARTGMDALCERCGLIKKPFEKFGATLRDELLISNVLFDADYVINLPKFKTHGLTLLTAAVKNMFGVVPGLKKSAYHRVMSPKEKFAEALVRIAEIRRPDLNIVDGIWGMAGNGPSAGFIVRPGLVAMSKNMHEMDMALSKLMGTSFADVDTLAVAEKMGYVDLGAGVSIIGDDISRFDMSDFRFPVSHTTNLRNTRFLHFVTKKIMSHLRVRPRIINDKCVKCGMCVKICPVECIKFSNKFPLIDNDKCIECYCCHEACPEHAIELRESLLLKVAKYFAERRKVNS